jgi:hypothetical protein
MKVVVAAAAGLLVDVDVVRVLGSCGAVVMLVK